MPQMSKTNKQISWDNGDKWSVEKDARRCTLIDREIDGSLTPDESQELVFLQDQMLEDRRRLAPLPLDVARDLHRRLLMAQSPMNEVRRLQE